MEAVLWSNKSESEMEKYDKPNPAMLSRSNLIPSKTGNTHSFTLSTVKVDNRGGDVTQW